VALGFGALSTAQGVHRAGWVLVALAVLAGTLLAATARSAQPAVRAVESAGPAAEPAAEVTAEPALARAC
jgi:hypothetical protein